MKKLLLKTGLASGAVGAALSVIDVALQPFPDAIETLLGAPAVGPFTLLSVLGLAAEGDLPLCYSLEIASNTVLFFLGGPALLLLLQFCRVKWRDGSHKRDPAAVRKLSLLAPAWGAAALAMTFIRPSAWTYFWWFAYGSPVTWLLGRARAPVFNEPWVYSLIVVGWLYYGGLVASIFWSTHRWRTYAIYTVLLISLALNVVGCRDLTEPNAFKQ